ncbi:MAG: outer-membrane lipoprotein carrier protein LolA [Candidatus Cloacimonetes bacterium]|nr:outer-membrane lipoprotein carrier protein LolA [Candidatus Cloacimonadota bacterium]
MKKISMIALLLWISLLMALSPAELKQRLNAQYDGLQSFEAKVKQINIYKQSTTKIEYNGNFYYAPGRMLMHFISPSLQRMQIIGGKAELYDAASKVLVKSSVQSQYAQLNPVEILRLYWDRSAVSILGQDKGIATVKLIPAKDPLVKEMTARVESQSGIIHSLKYLDPSENSVEYIFSGIKRNQGIPAGIWQFTYPKDTLIIDQ